MAFRTKRRDFLKAAAALVPAGTVAPGLIPEARAASAPEIPSGAYFTAAEKAWIEAAVARLIPADELGPGAKEAGVADFIDHQLAGPYGSADTWYMNGPWQKGTPEQGYQLRLTPAQLYRTAIRDVEEHCRKTYGDRTFAQLDAHTQDEVLHGLDANKIKLPGAPANQFFDMLWRNTQEGFLADPMYGGNRNFAGWKLIGFPGPRYNYVAEIEQHGKRYDMPMVSILGREPGKAKRSA